MTDAIRGYYRTLELETGASLDQIKQAYRELAKVWHPDRFPNDVKLQQKGQERLKQINIAYKELQNWFASGAAETQKSSASPQHSHGVKKQGHQSQESTINEAAIIKTSEGEMVLEFWPDVAPGHVANFITLAKKGFYDGTCFHRVIKGFMIQGGDPNTKDESKQRSWGTGGPGHQIKAEFNNKAHTRGVLSMARSQDPDSAGSQFFICHGDPRFLDNQYTAFGKLIKGDDVLEKIGTTKTAPGDRPLTRMNVESIKIVPRDSVK